MTQQFLPRGLRPESTHEETRAAAEHYYRAAVITDAEVHDILAPALGFPEYEPGSPGYSPDRVNYVTGDHVAQSLADMAAGRLVAAHDSVWSSSSTARAATSRPAAMSASDWATWSPVM